MRGFLVLGSVNILLGLIISASAAHGPFAVSGEAQSTLQTATNLHMLHGLGLCVIGLSLAQLPYLRTLWAAGLSILAGIVFFCGGIYVKTLLQITHLGWVVPWGGAALMLGWILFTTAWLRAGTVGIR